MSTDLDVAEGIAQLLAAASIGAYRTDGSVFLPADVAIVLGEPPETPNAAIGITPYPISDSAIGTDGTLGIQIMFRSADLDPRPVWTMRDATFDLLNGRTNVTLNGHFISQIWRQISAPLGRDQIGRYEHADSYYLNANRPPTAYRTD